jgi:hypothetical protein
VYPIFDIDIKLRQDASKLRAVRNCRRIELRTAMQAPEVYGARFHAPLLKKWVENG